MRTYKYILIVAALTLGVNAQTILVTTNNVLDLNPERDAISALEGAIRIRHTITDGSEALDVSAGFPIPLTIASRVDGYTNSVINTITNDGVGVVWWVIPFLGAGEYELKSTVTLPGDSFEVFDRYLSVTSTPSAAGDVTLSVTNNFAPVNNVTNTTEASVNIYNTTQVITAGVSSISFTGAVLGAITFEGNAVTQTGTTFNFSYIETNAVTPVLTDTNVTGNWSIDLTQGGVLLYYQTGAITSQSFTVSSTNDVTASEVILLTDTNAITWNTNIIWAGGSSPTQDTNDYERFVFSLYRNKIAGGYLEDD